eukprot:9005345-Pyramimonas_sp.AAC.1
MCESPGHRRLGPLGLREAECGRCFLGLRGFKVGLEAKGRGDRLHVEVLRVAVGPICLLEAVHEAGRLGRAIQQAQALEL